MVGSGTAGVAKFNFHILSWIWTISWFSGLVILITLLQFTPQIGMLITQCLEVSAIRNNKTFVFFVKTEKYVKIAAP